MQCGPIRSLIDLDPHTAHLHSGYDMPGELGMLHDWHLCEGHFPDFFQGLKHLLLPGEIGRYRYPIFPAPLTYRQPAVPAGLNTLWYYLVLFQTLIVWQRHSSLTSRRLFLRLLLCGIKMYQFYIFFTFLI